MTSIHDPEEPSQVSKASASKSYRIAGTLWCYLTAVVFVSFTVVYLARGAEAASRFIQRGPLSSTHVTLISVAVAWTLLGVLIAILYLRKITPANVVTLAGSFLIALLYINVVREPDFWRRRRLHPGREEPACWRAVPQSLSLCTRFTDLYFPRFASLTS